MPKKEREHPVDAHKRPTLLDRFSAWMDGTDLRRVSYLTPLDSVLLYGEDSCHSLFMGGLFLFDPSGPKLERDVVLKCVHDYALAAKGRMISRIIPNRKHWYSRPYCEIDPDFSALNHFEVVQVPAPGGKAEVEKVAGQVQARHLGFDHPPWKCFLLEGVDGDRSAIYWMCHHALSDAQGFIRYLLAFVSRLDEKGNLKEGDLDLHALSSMQYASGRFLAGEQKAEPVPNPIEAAIRTTVTLAKEFYHFLVGISIFILSGIYLVLFSYPKKSLLPPSKPLKQKQYAYSNKIPLLDLKNAKNALHVTINDLMVTAASTAVQRFLEHRKLLNEKELVYLIPASLRKPTDLSLSNATSAVYLSLSTAPSQPLDRLEMCASRLSILKKSYEPYVWPAVLYPLAFSFPWLLPKSERLWNAQKLSFITGPITNVPGPKNPLYWAGVRTDQYAPVICCVPGQIGIAILSLHDHITCGVLLDLDPTSTSPSNAFGPGSAREIIELFETAVAELLEASKEGREKGVVESMVDAMPTRNGGLRERLDEIKSRDETQGVLLPFIRRRLSWTR